MSRSRREVLLVVALVAFVATTGAGAVTGPWDSPPPLPAPTGTVVTVSTVADLQEAVFNVASGTTIMIEAGTYDLTNTLHVTGGVTNVAIRGATGDRGDVVIRGRGMSNADFQSVPHGILVTDAQDVLIADLSVGEVWYHPIALNPGCQRVRIYNCRLFDAGEQFVKASVTGGVPAVSDSTVEYCVLEYADTSRGWYTQGVDVHGGSNWIVRHCLFRNIRGPAAEPNVGSAVIFWNGSRDNVTEANTFLNCRQAICYGLMKRDGFRDNYGGVVRNNFIYREPGAVESPDGGIMVWDSPGTKVLHNTVLFRGTFGYSIEYRWTENVEIAGNLADCGVWQREEATGDVHDNLTAATLDMFGDHANADLRLVETATAALDQVSRHPDCTVDWEGDPRPPTGADLGADERELYEPPPPGDTSSKGCAAGACHTGGGAAAMVSVLVAGVMLAGSRAAVR